MLQINIVENSKLKITHQIKDYNLKDFIFGSKFNVTGLPLKGRKSYEKCGGLDQLPSSSSIFFWTLSQVPTVHVHVTRLFGGILMGKVHGRTWVARQIQNLEAIPVGFHFPIYVYLACGVKPVWYL